ncbi:hypothetical protein HZS_1610 [Henneguya salminicola]|nr:hypothetical protein HZS_1610 [Henneguya salminicola]
MFQTSYSVIIASGASITYLLSSISPTRTMINFGSNLICYGIYYILMDLFTIFAYIYRGKISLLFVLLFLILNEGLSIGYMFYVWSEYYRNKNTIQTWLFYYLVNYDQIQPRSIFNSIQRDYQCCGVKSISDWKQNIPTSCCINFTMPDCFSIPSNIFQKPCMILLFDLYNLWNSICVAMIILALIIVLLLDFPNLRDSVTKERGLCLPNRSQCTSREYELAHIAGYFLISQLTIFTINLMLVVLTYNDPLSPNQLFRGALNMKNEMIAENISNAEFRLVERDYCRNIQENTPPCLI